MKKSTIMLALGALLLPAAGLAVPVAVDCTLGPITSINAALATPGPTLEITITGPCTEDVIVTRDNVLLAGSVPGTPAATVITAAGTDVNSEGATVIIRDSRRVELRDLTLTGGALAGVLVTQSQNSILFTGLDLIGNGRWGAYLYDGATVRGTEVAAAGNGGAAGGGARGGFFITDAGNLSCFQCSVDNSAESSANYGVRILQAGSLSWLAGSSIVAGGDFGISATDGRVGVDNSSIVGDLYGIFATNSAITTRNGSTVTAAAAGGLAAVLATAGSDVRVTGGSLTSTSSLALTTKENSDAKVSGASLGGSVEVSGLSRVQLSAVTQTANALGNTASQGSYLRSISSTLTGATGLSEFANALFTTSGALAGTLTCSSGSDAICSGGTTFASSTCASCVVP